MTIEPITADNIDAVWDLYQHSVAMESGRLGACERHYQDEVAR